MYINKKISAYNHSSRYGQGVKFIVIHFVGAVSSAYNNVCYFAGGDRQSSAHYFVDEEAVWQSVEDGYASWHCGGPLESGHHPYHNICTNQNSIGIELCLKKKSGKLYIPKLELYRAQELVRTLMQKYGVPVGNVIRHYDVTGKACPNCVTAYDMQHTLLTDGAWGSIKKYLTTGAEPKNYKVGWFTKNGKTYYRDAKGNLAKGYCCIGQDNYYFNEEGHRCSGTFEIEGRLYNFNKNGRAEGGWKEFGNKKYFFSSDGKCALGLVHIGQEQYYFDEKGVMQTGSVVVKMEFREDGTRIQQ